MSGELKPLPKEIEDAIVQYGLASYRAGAFKEPKHVAISVEEKAKLTAAIEVAMNTRPAPPAGQTWRFNCFSSDDGDSWFHECPDDADIISSLTSGKVGDEFELLAGWRAIVARFRIVEVKDDAGDDVEVICISHPEMWQEWKSVAAGTPPAGSVSVPVEKLLAIRDALVLKDVDEAYHQLYNLVEWADPMKPWAEWIAAAGKGE